MDDELAEEQSDEEDFFADRRELIGSALENENESDDGSAGHRGRRPAVFGADDLGGVIDSVAEPSHDQPPESRAQADTF